LLVLKDEEEWVYLDDKDIVKTPISKKVLDAYKYTENQE
jgi:phosphate starvation-inducible PhoH-like protein